MACVIVLFLEKALRYDNPGRHDQKQQTMRINDLPHRLQICSGASGTIESGPRGTMLPVHAGVPFDATRMHSRAAKPFLAMPVTCHCELRRA